MAALDCGLNFVLASADDLRDFCVYRARGIDSASARRLLVNSFGSEVTRELQYPQLLARVEAAVKTTLATAGFSADAPAVAN